jgi:hypothetical protein
MFLRHDLDQLLAFDKRPAVSLYFPTHPAGRDVRQDAIRPAQAVVAAARQSCRGNPALLSLRY